MDIQTEYTKQELRDMAPGDSKYCGYWDGLYHFSVERDNPHGYEHYAYTLDDIESGMFIKLFSLGYSHKIKE